MLFLLLLNLIPALGTVLYAVLSVAFTLFFLAVEYTGFVFGRHRRSFRQQRRYLFSRKGLLLGFSTGVLVMLAVPFLQFICIPLAVVGATRLCHDFPEGGEGSGRAD
jgi:CysZ protein